MEADAGRALRATGRDAAVSESTAVLERWKSIAVEAAHAAGAVLMEHFGHIARSEVGSKSAARDLVTKADVASERAIVEVLRRELPGHAIEAEEEVRDARRADDELRWFVDPLDGTTNFVHQLPAFSVSLGLYRGSTPLVGVVHAPRLAETYAARAGGGVTLGQAPVRVSGCSSLRDAILATGFPYRRETLRCDNVDNFRRFILHVRDLRRMGSAALDLAYVAAGRMDGFWELHLAPHDVAAGALLVREAGGTVSDADGGEDWLRGGHIVACSPALHTEMLGKIAR
ncbi:MAG: inositol monophosphatase [Planctomycetes bacterium]|nr:inositol monophosphatase [Planctomycetota bacterium]